MKLSHLLNIAFSTLTFAYQDQSLLPATADPDDVHNALIKASIIPTVLTDFTPLCLLSITYANVHSTVDYGNVLNPNDLSEAPAFELSCPNGLGKLLDGENAGFVLALTDPDAPSRKKPKWSEMAHWVVSFAGENAGANVTELFDYKPPGPPKKTGKHRYVFVLMAGDISGLEPPKERQHWGYGKGKGKHGRKTKGVQQWSEENDLTVVGANWFEAKYVA